MFKDGRLRTGPFTRKIKGCIQIVFTICNYIVCSNSSYILISYFKIYDHDFFLSFLLNTNLGGFSFATVDNEDGYYKGDGEFHPFGNPYLRYNEDTGYIQALTTSGEWRNVFYTENLPMTCLYLFNNGMLLESLSGLTNLTYAYGTRNYVIEDNMLCPYAKGAGSYNAYGGFITNAPIDLSEYNELHVIAHVNAGTLSFDFIGSKNTAAPTSKLANYITSTTDVEVTVDISELSGEYYFRSSIIGSGNSTTYKGYISQIFLS